MRGPVFIIYISIHVLREEDDRVHPHSTGHRSISIHVLREEDDVSKGFFHLRDVKISIHVLREEDDTSSGFRAVRTATFLSTSSARRTT